MVSVWIDGVCCIERICLYKSVYKCVDISIYREKQRKGRLCSGLGLGMVCCVMCVRGV